MPILKAMDEHGYNTTDYYAIAPRYGTEQDLKDLVRAAHKKDMPMGNGIFFTSIKIKRLIVFFRGT